MKATQYVHKIIILHSVFRPSSVLSINRHYVSFSNKNPHKCTKTNNCLTTFCQVN